MLQLVANPCALRHRQMELMRKAISYMQRQAQLLYRRADRASLMHHRAQLANDFWAKGQDVCLKQRIPSS